jgi:hypothetical protein
MVFPMNAVAIETLWVHSSRFKGLPDRCFFADGTISIFANGLLGCWYPCTAAPAHAREIGERISSFFTDDFFGEHLFSSFHCGCVDVWYLTTGVHNSKRFLPGAQSVEPL